METNEVPALTPEQQEQPQRAKVEQAYGKEEADRLFGQDDTAERIYQERTEVQVKNAYGYDIAGMMRQTFNTNEQRLRDAGELTLAQCADERREFATMVRDLDLPIDEAARLHDLVTRARLAPPRTEAEIDEEMRIWARRARVDTRERYGRGAAEAEDLINRTDAFVRRTPVLAKYLAIGGLGSHPEVVEILTEYVRKQNIR